MYQTKSLNLLLLNPKIRWKSKNFCINLVTKFLFSAKYVINFEHEINALSFLLYTFDFISLLLLLPVMCDLNWCTVCDKAIGCDSVSLNRKPMFYV